MSEQTHQSGPTGEDAERAKDIRLGFGVLVALVVLALLEYGVFLVVKTHNLPIMIAMNVADAALILVYFMHLPRLWKHGGGH